MLICENHFVEKLMKLDLSIMTKVRRMTPFIRGKNLQVPHIPKNPEFMRLQRHLIYDHYNLFLSPAFRQKKCGNGLFLPSAAGRKWTVFLRYVPSIFLRVFVRVALHEISVVEIFSYFIFLWIIISKYLISL